MRERLPAVMKSLDIQEKQGERTWVRGLVPKLRTALAPCALPESQITVGDGVKLPYNSVIQAYSHDGQPTSASLSYETDLLISDAASDGSWTPRVVVECKLGGVTTHDALSYVAKAATHKHLHPYLRYGVLVGRLASIPRFLVRHGIDFDFLATWPADAADEIMWDAFVAMLVDEVKASRQLQSLLSTSRMPAQQKYHFLRRPLLLS